MIRIINFVCVAMLGLSCLGLYHVSEQTRVARVQLAKANHQITHELMVTSVLEAEWERVAEPGRIQRLAQERLGLVEATSAQLASLELLPRRGEDTAPLTTSPVRNANVIENQKQQQQNIRTASVRIGM